MTLVAVLAGGLGSVYAETASALPLPGARRPARPAASRGFNLFAGAADVWLNANRVQCNINNLGEQCVAPAGSTVGGGGYWPVGTGNQYIFNAGIQTAAIIDPASGFAWAGDTVATYFFDPRGDQTVGFGLSPVYNSLVADDIANWPATAFVRDTTLFDKSLVGPPYGTAPAMREAASQQDTWTRYWDGNVNIISGRPHPMGLLVDQRTMAWGYPTGNNDIVYFIMRFINITSGDLADYAGLEQYGYTAADIADIHTLALRYRADVLSKFGVSIPAHGYAFKTMYVGAAEDPDEGNAGANYSTANLPFSMDWVYKSNFLEPNWLYPSDIFSPPFAFAPGMSGAKFLKGPADASGNQIGVTMFTNTTNGGDFPDRVGSPALYRLMKADLIPADGNCLNRPSGNPPLCALVQSAQDTRMFMYSGPLDMAPGQSEVLVVSQVFAAPIGAAIQNDGYGHVLGSGSFDMPPGVPGTPQGYISVYRTGQTAVDTIRRIDRVVGWAFNAQNPGNNAQALDANANGFLEQDEIPTVKGSLLNKALVAQAVFNKRFLLPFAPDAPRFYLIPGSNQATVVWEASDTELPGHGDPYFGVASAPLNPDGSRNDLYDPNFRRYDVEGYRVWRGRSPSTMVEVASFDYAGTSMMDYTGQFNNSDYGTKCAPELGITRSCPAFPHTIALVGDVVQIGATGGRVSVLPDSSVVITKADTAVTGGASGNGALQDTGVPFVYIDRTVINGFRYFYAVTAFDLNSINSGPTSLQSAMVTQSVTPRVVGGNYTAGSGGATFDIVGTDGTVLNPSGAAPTIDATTGEFSGPALPTDGFEGLGAQFFADQLLQSGAVAYIRIDSVIPKYYHRAQYFLSTILASGAAQTQITATAGDYGVENGDHPLTAISVPLPGNSNLADSLGLGRVSLSGSASGRVVLRPGVYSSLLADYNGDVAGSFYAEPASWSSDAGGSRWFAGANESTADPTLAQSAGSLPNVTTIYKPTPYHNAPSIFRRFFGTTMLASRAADIRIYWGNTAGKPDSVMDVTHHVPVPFNGMYRASWGFVKDFTGGTTPASGPPSAPNGIISNHDFLYGPCFAYTADDGAPASVTMQGCETRFLDSVATLLPVSVASAASPAAGNGFGLYINGEPFIFQTDVLPQNTVWTYRSYYGEVTQATTYAFTRWPSSPAVPGLRLRATVAGTPATYSTTVSGDLSGVHTVPDPYYVTNTLEQTATSKVLRFVNLPNQAIIRIYSVSGVLVNVITHNDPAGGGEQVWNLRNRNNQFVASGVYFYHVETPDGQKKIGRFTVVNYAQ